MKRTARSYLVLARVARVFRYLLLPLSLSLTLHSSAQVDDLHFYTMVDGLSSNRIWSIAQTENGLLWMDGANGLNRYDGYQFLNHQNRTETAFALAGDDIVDLSAWGDSLILLQRDSLSFLNTQTGATFDLDFRRSITNRRNFGGYRGPVNYQDLLALPLYEQDRWVAILVYDQGQWEVRPLAGDPELFQGGSLPLLNENGSYYFHQPGNREILEISLEGLILSRWPAPEILPEIGTGILSNRGNGDLILSFQFDCFLWQKEEQQWVNLPIDEQRQFGIHHLTADPKGNLWIVFNRDRQLMYYEVEENRLTDYSERIKAVIPHHLIFGKMMVDQSNNLWLCSPTGILLLSSQESIFPAFLTESNTYCGGACSFRAFAENDQQQVFASFYHNIVRADRDVFSSSDFVFPASITSTPFDLSWRAGQLILANGFTVDPAVGRIENPLEAAPDPNRPGGLLETDEEGNYWWVYAGNLYQLVAGAEGVWSWELLLNVEQEITKDILDLIYDQQRNGLWMSSENQLVFYAFAHQQLRPDLHHTFSEINYLRKLELDDQGTLWLATESGLGHYDPETGTFELWAGEAGLPNNLVTGILPEGDSCLWISTFRGLSRFDKRTQTFLNFFKEDGLPTNEFNYRSSFLASDGQMYFGGMGGFTRFRPAEVQKKIAHIIQQGRLVLTELRVADGKQDSTYSEVFWEEGRVLELAHHHRQLDLSFALTNFQWQEPIQYSYRMLGISDLWSSPAVEHQTTYNRLPPGEYQFQLRAMDERGRWQQHQLDLAIRVFKPWYKSWWAYLIYTLGIVAFAIGISRFQRNRWQLHHALDIKQQEAEQLRELDDFKNRLFTNLTHEFRTPLTVMLGMSEDLAKKSTTELHDATQLIQRNGHELLRLVDQMLDLAKLDNGVYQLDLLQGDVIAYLHYLTQSFHSYANSRNQSLRFFSESEELIMDYDANALAKIVTNLIGNALKYSPAEGDIKVRVLEGAGNLLLSVSDNGPGIAAEELPFIFDRFYQSRSAGHANIGGVGIGLAFCKELSARMNAELSVESEVGKGSSFLLSLPIRNEAPLRTASRDHQSSNNLTVLRFDEDSQESSKVMDTELPQVLIVEDNVDVVTYLRTCLEPYYQVAIAYNGRIGWERALELTPDLIVSDVMMPEKDGFTLCDELKQDERTSHIPLILLTAKADASSRIQGLRRGADAYLAKPFNKEELLVRLEQLLVRQERMRQYFSDRKGSELQQQDNAWSTEEMDSEELQVTLHFEHSFLQGIQSIIAANYPDEDFGLPQLCQQLGMSRSQLFRKLKALIGLSPSELIRRYRLEKAKELLEQGEMNVSEVAWAVGFKHLSHFSKVFQEAYGYNPSDAAK